MENGMHLKLRYAAVAISMVLPACCAAAAQTAPPTQLQGIHIGEPADEVRRELSPKASFEKEEEGQQVWRVLKDPSVQYVFVGFDRERTVRYVTTVASPLGTPMPCAPLGDPGTAVKREEPGNIEMRRDIRQPGVDLTVIARGPSPDRLRICSIKKQGAGLEQEEEEEQRERPKHK
jgi:hypothetical protein